MDNRKQEDKIKSDDSFEDIIVKMSAEILVL